jgi:hypothetical protein
MNLTDQDINKLNDFTGFLSFITTWQAKKFFNCPNKTVGLFTGNQAMKTATTAYGYVLRVMGQHPVPKKNTLNQTQRIGNLEKDILKNINR